jgi:hypothetical protein
MTDESQTEPIPVQTKYKLLVVLGLALAMLAAVLAFTDLSVWWVILIGAAGFAVFIGGALGVSSDIKTGVRRARRST